MPILKLSYAKAAQLHILAMKDCGFIDADGRCRKNDAHTKCKQLASVHSINCDHLLYSLLPNYPSLCGTIAKFNLSA